MKNAIVKLGFCLVLFCTALTAHATPPTVQAVRVTSSPTNSSTVTFNVTFSAPVNNFTTGDVNLTGAAAAGATVSSVSPGPAAIYTVIINGISINGTLNVIIPPGAATEAASPFDASLASGGGIPNIVFDNTKPNVTITQPGQNDPTTGETTIKFTVTFSEPINPASFDPVNVAQFVFTGSNTGAGTLSISATNEIAPNDKTKWEVFVDVSASALGNKHVIISLPASTITDVAGNGNNASAGGDNDVTYAGVPPTSATPTAVPDFDRFTIFGEVLTDGGIPTVERGTVWSTSTPVSATDHKAMQGNGVGTFNQTRVASIVPETLYHYATYADNGVGGVVLSAEQSVYTLSDPPDNNSNITSATATSTTTIDVAFQKFGPIGDADGLIILRKAGTAPTDSDLKNGLAPTVGNMPLIIAVITNSNQTTLPTDTGLTPGTKYFYASVPFSWDGSHTETYNYKTGFSTGNATTFSAASFIGFNSAAATLDYATKTTSSPIAAASDGLSLASFTLYDGDNITADGDDRDTELHTLKLHVDNANMIRRIAINDGGTIHAEGTLDASGNITFTVGTNKIITTDDDSGTPDQFDIIASFDPTTVVDGAVIKVTITGATTYITGTTTGSEFALPDAGGANTGNIKNAIDVIGTKLVYSGVSNPINPGADFSLTITAFDANDVIDLNNGGSVTLSQTAGTGALNSTDTPGGKTRTLVSGTTTWTHLQFTTALNKTITANHNGSIPDKTLNVSVISIGTIVDGPGAPGVSTVFCFNNTSIGHGTFSDYGPITITESDPSDFAIGNNQTYSILLPPGFIFDVGVPPSATSSGADVSPSTLVTTYPANNLLRFTYNVSGTASVDQLTIANLKIKYTSAVPVTAQPILRIGGSAVQDRNADTDAQVHGLLSSGDGPIVVDFQNVAAGAVTSTQTSFSSVSNPPIVVTLQGLNTAGPTVLSGPTAVFSGDGIAFDGANYKFYPASVSNGQHDITFTYSDPVTGCSSNVTKTFNVFSSIINGLNATYCVNDAATTLLGPSGIAPNGGTCLLGFSFVNTYDNAHVVYKYLDIFGSWVDLPDQLHFNPGAPEFTNILAANSNTMLVSVWYVHQCDGSQLGWVAGQVTINPKPVIFINTTFPWGSCASDPIVDMTGTAYDNGNLFDEFWSSAVGAPGTPAPGINLTAPFKFNPAAANATASDITVQLNYRHKDGQTGCTNQVADIVSVWAKPGIVDSHDVSIKAVSNITNAQFCFQESLSPFSVTPAAGVFHKWAISPATRPPVEGDEYALSPNDFANVAGVPTTGSIAHYNLTQIVHRQFFFGFQVFNGCESDPLALSVEIMQPTTVSAGTTTVICEGNPLVLATLNASITSPTAGLNGTWSSTSAVPGVFKDTGGSVDNRFATAKTYLPSQEEIDARTVILQLLTDDPNGPCGPVISDVRISISPGVTITFPVSPVKACAATEIAIEGKVSNANLGIHWTENGLGSIDPTTTTKNIAVYNPDNSENASGATIVLTLATDDPDGPLGPCTISSNTVQLIISPKPTLSAGADYDVCSIDDIHLDGVKPTSSVATSWTWSTLDATGHVDIPSQLVTKFILNSAGILTDVSGFRKITFTITSNTPLAPNVCPAESDDVTITVHDSPNVLTITEPNPTYCVGETVALLSAPGASPTWYDASMAQVSTGSNFSTGVQADAEKKVQFFVTQTFDQALPAFAGCKSDPSGILITVNPLPVPLFNFANQCLGDVMQFTDQSTLQQPSAGSRTIDGWQWNFDDNLGNSDFGAGTDPIAPGTHDGTTTGTYANPGHKFRNTGNYAVRLTLITSDGCTATLTHTLIRVGPIPVAEYTVQRQCDEDDSEFTSSTGLNATEHVTYAWDFGDPSSGTGNVSTSQNPTHQFTGIGTYPVTLTLTTDLNCINAVAKQTSIYPFIKSFPYKETFESASHGWTTDGTVTDVSGVATKTSWNLLTSAGSIVSDPDPAAGSTFWATHTNAGPDLFYYDNERSVLYGPCVDMSALSRPVLAMDYFMDTESKGDGAYVEYKDEAADINAPWVRLGDNLSGLNWYNDSSIGGLSLLSGTGQNLSQFGWSGNDQTDNQWRTGRFNLDPFAARTRVRFRIVFGSNTSPVNTDTYDGFAIDNFKLETRNRLVLVENFTSKSSSTAAINNTNAFKNFPSVSASSEVVKIEYHTGLPVLPGEAEDPIFTQNPMDPNARASFYGLSAVPRGYIDGYSNLAGSGMFNGAWAGNYYSTESLKTSPLDIAIAIPTITDGTLNIKGTVTVKDFDLAANKYSLYVAVVEQTVGSDSYVLRKMLPSASGRKVPATAVGGNFTFDESWSVDKSYLTDIPHLIAVAFVQSDINNSDGERQVLQAAYNDNLPVVNFTTGVEVPFLQQTALYPNPADHLVNIELPRPTESGVEVKVIDQLGRPVVQSRIGIGEQSTAVNTSDLAGAVYIVQLKENGIYTTRRLVITHKH